MILENIKFHSGDKVYNTDKIEDIKPYSVLVVSGWSYSSSSGKISYILVYENRKYYVGNVECLHLYIGQDLRRQKKRDILFQTLIIVGLLALTILLFLYREAAVKGV